MEELQEVDLAAGGSQRVEIEVVDVDVAFAVGLGLLGGEQGLQVVVLGAFGTVLEHDAHRVVAVDVGVVALHVGVARVGEGQLVIDLHEVGVQLTHAGALGAVQDILARHKGVAGIHQHVLDGVLDILDAGRAVLELSGQPLLHLLCDALRFVVVAAGAGVHRPEHRILDLGAIVRDRPSVALGNDRKHLQIPL